MTKDKIISSILIVFIIAGVILRFYNLRYNNQFNWDQENLLALPAWDIVIHHKLTLIGPRTGVGNLYIGPLYSYLAAITFFILKMDPIAAPVLAGILSSVTLLFGFILTRRIFNTRVALIYTSIWTLSSFIFPFDRTPWNINLLALSSILLASGLWYLQTKDKNKGWILAAIGIYLGINAHFSVVFLISIVILFALQHKRKIISKSAVLPIIAILIGLAPLILFNIRHQNLLGRNLITFLHTSVTNDLSLPLRIINSLGLTLETTGRILMALGPSSVQKSVAMIFLIFLFILRHNKFLKKYLQIFILYFSVYFLGFGLYSGHVPDYYYMGLLPIVGIGMALIIDIITTSIPLLWIIVLLLLSNYLYSDYIHASYYDSYSLGVKQQIVQYIKKDAGDKVVDINFDMELGWSLGYDYLFDYYNVHKLKRADHNKTYWISYPKGRFPGKPDYVVGDIALGLPKTSQKIYNH